MRIAVLDVVNAANVIEIDIAPCAEGPGVVLAAPIDYGGAVIVNRGGKIHHLPFWPCGTGLEKRLLLRCRACDGWGRMGRKLHRDDLLNRHGMIADLMILGCQSVLRRNV